MPHEVPHERPKDLGKEGNPRLVELLEMRASLQQQIESVQAQIDSIEGIELPATENSLEKIKSDAENFAVALDLLKNELAGMGKLNEFEKGYEDSLKAVTDERFASLLQGKQELEVLDVSSKERLKNATTVIWATSSLGDFRADSGPSGSGSPPLILAQNYKEPLSKFLASFTGDELELRWPQKEMFTEHDVLMYRSGNIGNEIVGVIRPGLLARGQVVLRTQVVAR